MAMVSGSIQSQFQSQQQQHSLSGPSRRPRGRPPGSTNERQASNESGAASTRTKNGCWSCRVRRKKCDEGSANRQGICNNCARLEIECLGWGAKRPEWMKDKAKVEQWKKAVTQSLTDKGMIRGVPRTNPPAPPPFTYNPRAGRNATPPSDTPASPVNTIPGAGPIPRTLPARSDTTPSMMPTPPEHTIVVPTQHIHEISDDSDGDEFDFLNGDISDPLPQDPLFANVPPLMVDPMMMSTDISGMNLPSFETAATMFSPTEVDGEIISPGVGAAANFGNQYYGTTAVAPSVVFGPTPPYVPSNDWGSYSAGYTSQQNEYSNPWSADYTYPTPATTLVAASPYQEPPPFNPPMLRTPTVGLDQDRLRNMLILYYFKHVRQMQYVFAGDVTTNVMMQHAKLDPQGVVSLALCSLAALHDSRMRIASGIMANDQRARGPADKYYQKALARLEDNKLRTGRLSDADATAALHFVSFWLFTGGTGEWPKALEIAGDWYEQSNIASHENPMKALMEMDDNAKHASKTTMWMDIFSSISLCKSPRFLKLYQRLLQPNYSSQTTGQGLQLENVMGCADGIMLCLAEIADLAHWKATQKAAGCLSMPELVRRGLVIEKDLRREGYSLYQQRQDMAGMWGSVPPRPAAPVMDLPTGVRLGQSIPAPSSPPLPNAILDGDELRRLVSDIFREAAILYLHTELSELVPAVPEIKRAVRDTVHALQKLPCSEYDRSLVFPLALVGCSTDEPEMREYVRGRIKQLSSAVGNCATAGELIEHVWKRRDENPGLVLGWREAMQEINMTILLV